MIFDQLKYRIIISISFTILIIVIYIFYFNSPRSGNKAPIFSVKLIDQSDYSLLDSRGNYILLDFWGSWCSRCLSEIPELIKIKNKFKSSYFDQKSKLDVLTIAFEKKGDNWKKVAEKFNFDWKLQAVQFHNFILNSPLSNQYGVTEIPSKFLIDPNGLIILSNTSYSEIEKYLDSKKL
ncbi:MAG: hypothetical protein CL827_07890 [Crocinitomicaceae bacterium]|nr:hypothetical protein [Crocinitomicaceae bacterium]